MLSFAAPYEMWRDPTESNDDPDRWFWTTVIISTGATRPARDVRDRIR